MFLEKNLSNGLIILKKLLHAMTSGLQPLKATISSVANGCWGMLANLICGVLSPRGLTAWIIGAKERLSKMKDILETR